MHIARFFRKGKTVERYRAMMALLFEKYRVALQKQPKNLETFLNDVEFALKKGFLKVKIHHPQLVKMFGHQHIKIHPLQPVKRFAHQNVKIRHTQPVRRSMGEDDHTISDEDEEEFEGKRKRKPP
ncbi:hypothetical protein DPMN_022252 [Dreissena polymorpha]|uniref:Uncharacterized protein n=1 Tax=Dreissena polymorpha TaxID=45954 RepID=A0A9D4NM79_DREPO|nr:hypothetical protein DPMN_022252 [Dreissena polymorpha]